MSAIFRVAATARVALMASPVPMRGMAAGVVKWFNVSKGFGFITPDDKTQPDIFAHHSGIQSNGFRSLDEGEAVKYDVQKTERGLQAVNITNPEGAPFDRTATASRPPSRGPRRDGPPGAGRPRSPRAGSPREGRFDE